MSGEKSRFGFGNESELFFEVGDEFIDKCIANGAVVFRIDVQVVAERSVGIEMNVYDIFVEAIGLTFSAPGASVASAEAGDVIYGGKQTIGFLFIRRGQYDAGAEIEWAIVKRAQRRAFEFDKFHGVSAGCGRWLEAFCKMNLERSADLIAVFGFSGKGDCLRITVEIVLGQSKTRRRTIDIEDGDDFEFTFEIGERFGESCDRIVKNDGLARPEIRDGL